MDESERRAVYERAQEIWDHPGRLESIRRSPDLQTHLAELTKAKAEAQVAWTAMGTEFQAKAKQCGEDLEAVVSDIRRQMDAVRADARLDPKFVQIVDSRGRMMAMYSTVWATTPIARAEEMLGRRNKWLQGLDVGEDIEKPSGNPLEDDNEAVRTQGTSASRPWLPSRRDKDYHRLRKAVDAARDDFFLAKAELDEAAARAQSKHTFADEDLMLLANSASGGRVFEEADPADLTEDPDVSQVLRDLNSKAQELLTLMKDEREALRIATSEALEKVERRMLKAHKVKGLPMYDALKRCVKQTSETVADMDHWQAAYDTRLAAFDARQAELLELHDEALHLTNEILANLKAEFGVGEPREPKATKRQGAKWRSDLPAIPVAPELTQYRDYAERIKLYLTSQGLWDEFHIKAPVAGAPSLCERAEGEAGPGEKDANGNCIGQIKFSAPQQLSVMVWVNGPQRSCVNKHAVGTGKTGEAILAVRLIHQHFLRAPTDHQSGEYDVIIFVHSPNKLPSWEQEIRKFYCEITGEPTDNMRDHATDSKNTVEYHLKHPGDERKIMRVVLQSVRRSVPKRLRDMWKKLYDSKRDLGPESSPNAEYKKDPEYVRAAGRGMSRDFFVDERYIRESLGVPRWVIIDEFHVLLNPADMEDLVAQKAAVRLAMFLTMLRGVKLLLMSASPVKDDKRVQDLIKAFKMALGPDRDLDVPTGAWFRYPTEEELKRGSNEAVEKLKDREHDLILDRMFLPGTDDWRPGFPDALASQILGFISHYVQDHDPTLMASLDTATRPDPGAPGGYVTDEVVHSWSELDNRVGSDSELMRQVARVARERAVLQAKARTLLNNPRSGIYRGPPLSAADVRNLFNEGRRGLRTVAWLRGMRLTGGREPATFADLVRALRTNRVTGPDEGLLESLVRAPDASGGSTQVAEAVRAIVRTAFDGLVVRHDVVQDLVRVAGGGPADISFALDELIGSSAGSASSRSASFRYMRDSPFPLSAKEIEIFEGGDKAYLRPLVIVCEMPARAYGALVDAARTKPAGEIYQHAYDPAILSTKAEILEATYKLRALRDEIDLEPGLKHFVYGSDVRASGKAYQAHHSKYFPAMLQFFCGWEKSGKGKHRNWKHWIQDEPSPSGVGPYQAWDFVQAGMWLEQNGMWEVSSGKGRTYRFKQSPGAAVRAWYASHKPARRMAVNMQSGNNRELNEAGWLGPNVGDNNSRMKLAQTFLLELFNAKQNSLGEYLSVIVGKETMKEGTNLVATSTVHALNPFRTGSVQSQVVGRVSRRCSFADLKGSDNKFRFKMYLTASEENMYEDRLLNQAANPLEPAGGCEHCDELTEFYRYNNGSRRVAKLNQVMIEASFDCQVFRDYNRPARCFTDPAGTRTRPTNLPALGEDGTDGGVTPAVQWKTTYPYVSPHSCYLGPERTERLTETAALLRRLGYRKPKGLDSLKQRQQFQVLCGTLGGAMTDSEAYNLREARIRRWLTNRDDIMTEKQREGILKMLWTLITNYFKGSGVTDDQVYFLNVLSSTANSDGGGGADASSGASAEASGTAALGLSGLDGLTRERKRLLRAILDARRDDALEMETEDKLEQGTVTLLDRQAELDVGLYEALEQIRYREIRLLGGLDVEELSEPNAAYTQQLRKLEADIVAAMGK